MPKINGWPHAHIQQQPQARRGDLRPPVRGSVCSTEQCKQHSVSGTPTIGKGGCTCYTLPSALLSNFVCCAACAVQLYLYQMLSGIAYCHARR
jgi:hypothetical protein